MVCVSKRGSRYPFTSQVLDLNGGRIGQITGTSDLLGKYESRESPYLVSLGAWETIAIIEKPHAHHDTRVIEKWWLSEMLG